MSERQNIEWKESWQDKYLAWVCGFANAIGGVITIGKDDDGNVVGVSDFKICSKAFHRKFAIQWALSVIFNCMKKIASNTLK